MLIVNDDIYNDSNDISICVDNGLRNWSEHIFHGDADQNCWHGPDKAI